MEIFVEKPAISISVTLYTLINVLNLAVKKQFLDNSERLIILAALNRHLF